MNEQTNHPSITQTFRIAAKSFFITYPQCTATKEEIRDFLLTKGRPTYYLIGRELHEDGNPHIHALVTYEKKLNVKRQTFFDYNGFHPNIQAAKNIPALKNYIQKDDLEPLASIAEDDNLYNLARETPCEETFFEICRKRKVHPSIDYRFPICMQLRHSERYNKMHQPTQLQPPTS